MIEIEIRDEYIRMDTLLKLAGLVGTGGEAKIRIAEGEACFNGEVCTMRGKKCRSGDVVSLGGQEVQVR